MAANARFVFTDHRHGDLRIADGSADDAATAALSARRADIHPAPWTWLVQEHGGRVIVAEAPGDGAGSNADAVVTTAVDAPISVTTADCAPVLLEGPGTIAVVHAGWKGLAAGVIERAAETMSEVGSAPTSARLGPCIRARCYEFDGVGISEVATRYGPGVVSTTAWSTPALDLAAAVHAACSWLDIPLQDLGTCTACSPVHWSHRAGGDHQRQALVAWIEPGVPGPDLGER